MQNPFNLLKKPATEGSHHALVGDTVVAESPDTQRVDGYEYFPPDTVNWELLAASDRTSVCPWKGVANYYDVIVDGERLPAAAWSYKSPSDAVQHIGGHVAFWRGVKVVKR